MDRPDSRPRQYPLAHYMLHALLPRWDMDPGTHECGIESGKELAVGVVRTRGLQAAGQHLTAQSFEVASCFGKDPDQEEGRPVAFFPPAPGGARRML